jgi:EmrB/QacA subfamily drug resistance transporter
MTSTSTRAPSAWIALCVLCAGVLMVVLDASVVNVVLPVVQQDLHLSTADLAWVTNAYLIPYGGLLLLAGRLGDLLGRRRVFLIGLTVFTAASIACGLAANEAMLIAARFVQGVGGALASAVVLGIIVTMFTDAREQARAIGVYGFIAAAGGAIGVLAGGGIAQVLDWHWIFFINAPIGVATVMSVHRYVPADTGPRQSRHTDAPGAVLVTAAVMLAVYAIVGPASRDGVLASRTITLFAGALACLIAFVVRESTATAPLMPLHLFRSRATTTGNVATALVMGGMYGASFLAVLYMQRSLGYGPMATGLAFLPLTVLIAVVSLRYSARLADRYGPRSVLMASILLIALGLALLARAPLHGGAYLPDLLPAMLLLGAGNGVAFPLLMTVAMSDTAPDDAGLASGLINTTSEVAAALGLALLAALAAAGHGYRLGFSVAAGVTLLAVAVTAFGLRPARSTATAPVLTEPCTQPV